MQLDDADVIDAHPTGADGVDAQLIGRFGGELGSFRQPGG